MGKVIMSHHSGKVRAVWMPLFIAVCIAAAGAIASPDEQSGGYRRIVSLLPSITEVLFALDQGDKVVGVTRYCKYPPEAQGKAQVGGILDMSFEVVYRLQPDLVILGEDATDQETKLEQMGLKTLTIETRSVKGIIASIAAMGQALDCEQKAQALIEEIEKKIASIKSKTSNLPKPKILITYLRPVGEGVIRDVYIAGNHTYFNDLIEIIGGTNVYQGADLITSPVVSAEGILRMDPDVIIEVLSELGDIIDVSPDAALKDWEGLAEIKAYQNHRIYIFTQPYLGIPGPRLIQTLDDLARAVHPELTWD